jgi:hypothetical protein
MCVLHFSFMGTKARATPLGGITFQHNKTLTDVKRLRALFPINDGAVFSREKNANRLEIVQKAYGEFGFANYTGVSCHHL